MSPRVSIVMLCYNKLEYTRKGIAAVRQNTDPALYELIVVDNASSDGTQAYLTELAREFSNLRPILNPENLGFVGGNNRGAEAAAGQYLYFINNDTEVRPGWLEPLVQLMEQDASIGIVGSKLIYPDGRLQEAGGLVFQGGDAWNYGRLEDPQDPEYNYTREVDYCSGTALMIRTALFRRLGGFDTRFMPIYWEDTDLCFAAREAGYRVLYVPQSEIVHHEGVTSGTDVKTGIKRHQELNKPKFLQKWSQAMARQPAPPADLKAARRVCDRRSRQGKRLLVLMKQAPTADRAVEMATGFLQTALRAGHHVTVALRTAVSPETNPLSTWRAMGVLVAPLDGMAVAGQRLEQSAALAELLGRREYEFGLLWDDDPDGWFTATVQSSRPDLRLFAPATPEHDTPLFVGVKEVAIGSLPAQLTASPLADAAAAKSPLVELGVTLGAGFHQDEGGWRWLDREASIYIWAESMTAPNALLMDLTCDAARNYPVFPFQVRCYLGEDLVNVVDFTEDYQQKSVTILLRPSTFDVRLRLESTAAFSPAAVGFSSDERVLSVRLSQIQLQSSARLRNTAVELAADTWRCNVCGAACQTPVKQLEREKASCPKCQSTPRYRAVIHALSSELFGRSLALSDCPVRQDIRGFGLSDWIGYAARLQEKFDYTNTFYHKEPYLDITAIDPALEGTLDFLISSEVFEHVPPPVSRAFEGAHRLLKPGGVLVLTVPYGLQEHTVEHFPDLHNFEIVTENGKTLLKNQTRDGQVQHFDDLVFHGGPGSTLEMRFFAQADLRAGLEQAGFKEIKFWTEAQLDYGIYWPQPWSWPITARA